MIIMLLVALAGLVAGFSFMMIEITCRVETLENEISEYKLKIKRDEVDEYRG